MAPEELKIRKAIDRLRFENPAISQAEAKKLAPGRCRQVEDRGPEHFYQWLREEIGVCCFADRPDEILMWSHYGGGHNGICVELAISDEDHVDFFANIHEVAYSDTLPIVNFYTSSDEEKVRAYVLTKASHWEYEKESRYVLYEISDSRFVEIPDGAINTVFLGARISVENTRMVLDLVAQDVLAGRMQVFQMKTDEESYSLKLVPVILDSTGA